MVNCLANLLDFVRKVVRRVVIHTGKIDLEISRTVLRAILTNRLTTSNRESRETSLDELVRLTVQARLKRCGNEMRLVLIPDHVSPEMVTPLVNVIVRARAEFRASIPVTTSRYGKTDC